MSYLLHDLAFFAFRIAAANTEDFDFAVPILRLIMTMLSSYRAHRGTAQQVPLHDLFLCRGDIRNFRHDLWPDYKANRKTEGGLRAMANFCV